MRKKLLAALLSLLLCAVSLCGAEESHVPGNALGMAVAHRLYTPGTNLVFSPVSLSMTLGPATEGAAGSTRAELTEALRLTDTGELSGLIAPLSEAGLRIANAAFAGSGLKPLQSYRTALEQQWGAEWFEPSATLLEDINRWAAEHTDGLIDPFLTVLPSNDPPLMLASAAVMDCAWAMPIYENDTFTGTFHASEGDIETEFLQLTDTPDYLETDSFRCAWLPYRNSTLELLLILPEEEGAAAMSELLSDMDVQRVLNDAAPVEVELVFPKLDITCDSELTQPLTELGIVSAFSREAADFSAISEDPLYIGSVFQKARVQMDEQGTRAAAVTGMNMALAACPPSQTEHLYLDRPYAALIVDTATGVICFVCVIEDPTK